MTRQNRCYGLIRSLSVALLAASACSSTRNEAVDNSRVVTYAQPVVPAGLPPADVEARFYAPQGLTLTTRSQQLLLVIADTLNSTVRLLDVDSGLTTTVAGSAGAEGSADGTGADARFRRPQAVIRGSSANTIYVADTENDVIRKVDISTGVVSTIAGAPGIIGANDGSAAVARFNRPQGLAIVGQLLYITDTDNSVIRVMDVGSGAVTTLAGTAGTTGTRDGTRTTALFNHPTGLAYDNHRKLLYVAEPENHTIRAISVGNTNAVTTIAGTAGLAGYQNGAPLGSQFGRPSGLVYAENGLFVTDSSAYMVRRIDLLDNVVSTLAGAAWELGSEDGPGDASRFRAPSGIVWSRGRLYVADTGNHTVREIDVATDWLSSRSAGDTIMPASEAQAESQRAVPTVRTLTGQANSIGSVDGWAPRVKLGRVEHVLCDGDTLFVDGLGVHSITLTTGHVDTVLGTSSPAPMARLARWLYITRGNEYTVERIDLSTRGRTVSSFDNTNLGAILARDGFLHIAEAGDGDVGPNLQWSVVKFAIGADGALSDSWTSTLGLEDFGAWQTTSEDRFLYTSDAMHHVIKRKSASTGITTVIAGAADALGSDDGSVGQARFNSPSSVCLNGTDLYIADTLNESVRKLDLATNVVTTVTLDQPGSFVPGALANGQACAASHDCQSGVCDNQLCRPITCRDGRLQLVQETDIDCGAGCGPCKRTAYCQIAGDCRNGDGCAFGVCSAPNYCTNGVLDLGLEIDVDCGGKCKPCAIGSSNCASEFCTSRQCSGSACAAPTAECSNHMRDYTETGIDCGGWCPACP